MNKEEIETYRTDTPVCPRCGFTSVDLEGFLDETGGNDQCTECGNWYSWESERTIEFYTREIDWLEMWRKYNISQIRLAELAEHGIYKEI